MRDKMTDATKALYNQNPEHYELIETIVKKAQTPTNTILKTYIGISILVFGFLFNSYIDQIKEMQSKANVNDTLTKIQYYQIEEDEHRVLLEMAPDVNKATNIYNKINDNIAKELGFKYTTRGGGIK